MAVRTRLKQSWRNGMRVMAFSYDIEEEAQGDGEAGLSGLEDVMEELDFHFDDDRPPILCLAGPSDISSLHASGCGHAVARNVWDDDL